MPKILIIDDSKFARLKLSRYLKKGGYEVIEAENGKIGLKKALYENPDCIICDILMPVMNGFEFVEKFKSTGLDIPVFNMTTDIQNSTKERILKLGSSAVFEKPPKDELLLKAIKSALNDRE